MTGPNDNKTTTDDDLEQIPAGAEVDDTVVDDAERDEIAAREAEAAAQGEQPPSREDILADVRKAMQEAAPDADEDGAAPAPKPEGGDASKKPVAGATTPAQPAAATPAAPEAAAAEEAAQKAEAERKAAVDKEFNELQKAGKDKTRDRFHELNRQVAESAAVNEGLTKIVESLKVTGEDGKPVSGVAAVSAITKQLEQHREFEDAIFASGVSADDFRNVSAYKAAINSNDPVAWENARDFLRKELDWLETERMQLRPKEAGKQAYEMHQDLVDKVGTGALDPADANELAQARNLRTASTKARETGQQTEAQQRAAEQGANACATMAQTLAASNAAAWQAKWPVLKPKLEEIRTKYPPDQWADRMELEYHRIQVQAPVATPAAPAAGNGASPAARQPIKPGALPRAGVRRPASQGGALERNHDDESPLEALRRGIVEAGGQIAG